MPDTEKIRIVCISDTHNKTPGEGYTLPATGDILIHAGDLTNQGSLSEIQKAVAWLSRQTSFKTKIVIAGNHDLSLDPDYNPFKHASGWKVQPSPGEALECRRLLTENDSFVYLQHTSQTIQVPEKGISLKVFGSPYSPDRGRQNWAFQYDVETEAARLWSEIPDDTDIVVSHTPAKGVCDASKHWSEGGCPGLLGEGLWRTRPLLHVCGHCHEGRGAKIVRWGEKEGEVEGVREWEDPGRGSKKQSVLDLTGGRRGMGLEGGRETAVVNASVMAKSFGRGGMEFNKPIVVDLAVPCRQGR
ncbi:hypothetical protein NU195Hw_g2057t1 [Hortaea werneckii]